REPDNAVRAPPAGPTQRRRGTVRHPRSTLLTGLAAASALTLAACSGGGGDSGGDDTPDGPVDLRVTVWTASEDHLELFNDIADTYIADHPDEVSSVTFETVPFDDYTTTLTTQIAGGDAPHRAWVFEATGPEFAAGRARMDLGPTFEATDGYDLEDVDPAPLELWQSDGGLYAYPFSNSPFVMFVNTDRVSESGQDNPADLLADGEWTYDAARDISAGSVDELGGAGLVVREL